VKTLLAAPSPIGRRLPTKSHLKFQQPVAWPNQLSLLPLYRPAAQLWKMLLLDPAVSFRRSCFILLRMEVTQQDPLGISDTVQLPHLACPYVDTFLVFERRAFHHNKAREQKGA
jgi:hypothetical protein